MTKIVRETIRCDQKLGTHRVDALFLVASSFCGLQAIDLLGISQFAFKCILLSSLCKLFVLLWFNMRKPVLQVGWNPLPKTGDTLKLEWHHVSHFQEWERLQQLLEYHSLIHKKGEDPTFKEHFVIERDERKDTDTQRVTHKRLEQKLRNIGKALAIFSIIITLHYIAFNYHYKQ